MSGFIGSFEGIKFNDEHARLIRRMARICEGTGRKDMAERFRKASDYIQDMEDILLLLTSDDEDIEDAPED